MSISTRASERLTGLLGRRTSETEYVHRWHVNDRLDICADIRHDKKCRVAMPVVAGAPPWGQIPTGRSNSHFYSRTCLKPGRTLIFVVDSEKRLDELIGFIQEVTGLTHPKPSTAFRVGPGEYVDESLPNLPKELDLKLGRVATRLAEITLRPAQAQFRAALINRYGAFCQITRCDVRWVVQAAHITPFADEPDDRVENGLLLRSDVHLLFDAELICINPTTLKVAVAKVLTLTEYGRLDGQPLRLPDGVTPDMQALNRRWERRYR